MLVAMCGRFSLSLDDYSVLTEMLGVAPIAAQAALYRPRYNIAPTDPHWLMVRDQKRRKLLRASWGFHGPRLVINARSETADKKPMFRGAFSRGRCIVPADGFFEWKGSGKKRRPVWFHSPERDLLRMAGLYEARDDGKLAFVVLTTAANRLVAAVHDRMPVILSEETATAWLQEPNRDLLNPAAESMLVASEVSTRVNSVKNDDPGCLQPPSRDEVAAEEAKGVQLRLY